MKKSILIILLLVFVNNAFALVASDIDMSSATTDVTTIIVSILSFLVLLMGYKKVLSLLGR